MISGSELTMEIYKKINIQKLLNILEKDDIIQT